MFRLCACIEFVYRSRDRERNSWYSSTQTLLSLMQIERSVLDRRVVSSTCDSLFEFHKVVQRLLLFMNAAVLLILYVGFCLLETFVVIDAVHSTICWNLFIFLQAICIEWRIFLFFIVVWLLEKKNRYYVINGNWINESNRNLCTFFLTFSSNFRPCKRDSMVDNGLSLLVGDPPRTYSTILTPSPPVESRGL